MQASKLNQKDKEHTPETVAKFYKEPKHRYDTHIGYPKLYFAHKDGGLNVDYEKNQLLGASLFGDILKQVGNKVMQGNVKNIMQLSKPLQLCESISQTEFLAYDNYPTHFLDLAAESKGNPVQRMQYVLCFLISAVKCGIEKLFNKLPLDPTLGETSQLVKENGTKYYAEAFSVAPPEVYINIVGPQKKWKLEYLHKVKAQLIMPKMNDIDASAIGYKKFKFDDGTEILAENIIVHIGGLIVGGKTYKAQKNLRLIDMKNNLQGEILFNYNRQGTISKLTSSFSSLFNSSKGQEKKPHDSFEVSIYKYMDVKENIKAFFNKELNSQGNYGNYKEPKDCKAKTSQGTGNYTSYMQFDGQVFWQVTDPIASWVAPNYNLLLKSDSSNRIDTKLLQQKKLEEANKAKQQLEMQDQEDQQLRSIYKKNKNIK